MERYSDERPRFVTVLNDELRPCNGFGQVLCEERKHLKRFRSSHMRQLPPRKFALPDRVTTLQKTRVDILRRPQVKADVSEAGVTLSLRRDILPHRSKELKVIAPTLLNDLASLRDPKAVNQKIVARTFHHFCASTGFAGLSRTKHRAGRDASFPWWFDSGATLQESWMSRAGNFRNPCPHVP